MHVQLPPAPHVPDADAFLDDAAVRRQQLAIDRAAVDAEAAVHPASPGQLPGEVALDATQSEDGRAARRLVREASSTLRAHVAELGAQLRRLGTGGDDELVRTTAQGRVRATHVGYILLALVVGAYEAKSFEVAIAAVTGRDDGFATTFAIIVAAIVLAGAHFANPPAGVEAPEGVRLWGMTAARVVLTVVTAFGVYGRYIGALEDARNIGGSADVVAIVLFQLMLVVAALVVAWLHQYLVHEHLRSARVAVRSALTSRQRALQHDFDELPGVQAALDAGLAEIHREAGLLYRKELRQHPRLPAAFQEGFAVRFAGGEAGPPDTPPAAAATAGRSPRPTAPAGNASDVPPPPSEPPVDVPPPATTPDPVGDRANSLRDLIANG